MSFARAEILESMASEISQHRVARPEGYLHGYRVLKRGAKRHRDGHYKWDQVAAAQQMLRQGFSVRKCVFVTGLCRDTVKKIRKRL